MSSSLPVAAGCDVCCTLQCSNDDSVRSPVSRKDKRSMVNSPVSQVWRCIPVVGQIATTRRLRRVSSSCCCIGGGHTHVQGGATSWDSSGSENISRPGLCFCEPSGFRGDARVCECQSAHHSVNACVVSSRSFGGAAGFFVFQLWVQEGAAQAALAESCPCHVSKSFLHMGDVVMRRQDTSRTRVQVVKPTCGSHASGTSLRFS